MSDRLPRSAAPLAADRQPLSSPTSSAPARRALFVGAAWLTAGIIVSRLITLGIMIGAARLLGRAVFGELCLIQQTVILASVVASYGPSVTAATRLAKLRDADPARAGRVLSVLLLTSLLLGLASAGLIAALQTMPSSEFLSPLKFQQPIPTMLWLVAASLSLTAQGCLSGFSAFRATTGIQFLEAVASCLLVPVGVLFGGLNGAVFGFAAASLIGGATAVRLLWLFAGERGISLSPPAWSAIRDEAEMLRNYCLPVMLAGQIGALANWLCLVLLVRATHGYAELAIFNAASYWFNALILVPNILQRVGTVMHSSALGRNNPEAGRAIYRDSVLVNSLLILGAAIPLAALSPQLMELFGPEFRDGWPTMVICLLTAACLSVVKPAEQSLFATGRTWTVLGLCTLFAVGFVGLGAAWSSWGAQGMALSRLTVYVVHAVLMSVATHRFDSRAQPPAAVVDNRWRQAA